MMFTNFGMRMRSRGFHWFYIGVYVTFSIAALCLDYTHYQEIGIGIVSV